MRTGMLRVLVADDERPARRFLVNLLKTCQGVELVGEASTGEEAVALIESARPDVALLDLQMPELGGLDVVRRVAPEALSLVAFVTTFEDFAIEAFELNAIDYLLKPIRQVCSGNLNPKYVPLLMPIKPRSFSLNSGIARRSYTELTKTITRTMVHTKIWKR